MTGCGKAVSALALALPPVLLPMAGLQPSVTLSVPLTSPDYRRHHPHITEPPHPSLLIFIVCAAVSGTVAAPATAKNCLSIGASQTTNAGWIKHLDYVRGFSCVVALITSQL